MCVCVCVCVCVMYVCACLCEKQSEREREREREIEAVRGGPMIFSVCCPTTSQSAALLINYLSILFIQLNRWLINETSITLVTRDFPNEINNMNLIPQTLF